MRALEVQVGDKEKPYAAATARSANSSGRWRSWRRRRKNWRAFKTSAAARTDRHAREALVKESELKYGATISNLQNEVAEKGLLLQVRDNELKSLKAEVKAVHARLNEISAAREQAESSLQEDLRKERQRRLEQEAATSELEQRYGKDIETLRSRVGEKDESLKHREGELESLKTQLASLAEQLTRMEAAKERANGALEEQVRKEQEIRQASDSAIRTLEENFKAKITSLEKQVSEKQQAAGSQVSSEVTALRSAQVSQPAPCRFGGGEDKAERCSRRRCAKSPSLCARKRRAIKRLNQTSPLSCGPLKSSYRKMPRSCTTGTRSCRRSRANSPS
jgi:chromosome segregation ATPase